MVHQIKGDDVEYINLLTENDMKKYVDRDQISYDDSIDQRKYAVYCRELKKKGLTPLQFDEWKINRPISTDIDRCNSIPGDIQLSTINYQQSAINNQLSNNTTSDVVRQTVSQDTVKNSYFNNEVERAAAEEYRKQWLAARETGNTSAMIQAKIELERFCNVTIDAEGNYRAR